MCTYAAVAGKRCAKDGGEPVKLFQPLKILRWKRLPAPPAAAGLASIFSDSGQLFYGGLTLLDSFLTQNPDR